MAFYETDVLAVLRSGRGVAGQSRDAVGLAGQYLRSLENASEWVKHPTVMAAVERYRTAWQPPVNRVAQSINALGTNTGASGVTVANADADSDTVLGRQVAVTGALTRPINDGLGQV